MLAVSLLFISVVASELVVTEEFGLMHIEHCPDAELKNSEIAATRKGGRFIILIHYFLFSRMDFLSADSMMVDDTQTPKDVMK